MWRVTDLSGLPSMPFMRRNAAHGQRAKGHSACYGSIYCQGSELCTLAYQDPSRSFKSPCPLLVWLASSPQGILHFAHQKKFREYLRTFWCCLSHPRSQWVDWCSTVPGIPLSHLKSFVWCRVLRTKRREAQIRSWITSMFLSFLEDLPSFLQYSVSC